MINFRIFICIKFIFNFPFIKFRGDDLPHNGVQYCAIHAVGEERFIFTLCKDLKMRIWSCQVITSMLLLFTSRLIFLYCFLPPTKFFLSFPLHYCWGLSLDCSTTLLETYFQNMRPVL